MTPSSAAPAGPLSWQEPLSKDGNRPAESGKAWEAFCLYRDLGPDRSFDKVYQKCSKSVSLLARWSGLYHWVERAQAYDLYKAELVRRASEVQHAALITAYRERAAKIGAATADVSRGFLVAAGMRLKTLTDGTGTETVKDIPITSLPSFLRAAAAVAQISLSVEAESLGIHALEDLMNTHEDEGAAES